MDELLKLEEEAKRITEETATILRNNFPMDSREFLSREEALRVRKNDIRIEEIGNKYLNTYVSLSLEEQKGIDYKNLTGTYYQTTYKSEGLISVSQFSDEYDLKEAFGRAYAYGLKALDSILLAEQNNDAESLEKNRRILATCKGILREHFWGESYLESLDRYDKRIRSGRTVEDDVADYDTLVQETRELAYEYAKLRLGSPTEAELDDYFNRFEKIFEREKLLTEFVPREAIREIYVNLHWLKVDAERTPEKVVEEHDNGFGLK